MVREKASVDGLVVEARDRGLYVKYDYRWWYCPFCNKDIREQDLESHMNTKLRKQKKDYKLSFDRQQDMAAIPGVEPTSCTTTAGIASGSGDVWTTSSSCNRAVAMVPASHCGEQLQFQ